MNMIHGTWKAVWHLTRYQSLNLLLNDLDQQKGVSLIRFKILLFYIFKIFMYLDEQFSTFTVICMYHRKTQLVSLTHLKVLPLNDV